MPKKRKCPSCPSGRVAEFVYGMVPFDLYADQVERGEVIIAGCIIEPDAPFGQCTTCDVLVWDDGDFAAPGTGRDAHRYEGLG